MEFATCKPRLFLLPYVLRVHWSALALSCRAALDASCTMTVPVRDIGVLHVVSLSSRDLTPRSSSVICWSVRVLLGFLRHRTSGREMRRDGCAVTPVAILDPCRCCGSDGRRRGGNTYAHSRPRVRRAPRCLLESARERARARERECHRVRVTEEAKTDPCAVCVRVSRGSASAGAGDRSGQVHLPRHVGVW
eukprot:COSAG03_NODE_2253_length_2956_cov_10.344067_5_plen_192_part_00